MYDEHTEMARNCNVINDHQALSRKIGARRGTERLRRFLGDVRPILVPLRVQGTAREARSTAARPHGRQIRGSPCLHLTVTS